MASGRQALVGVGVGAEGGGELGAPLDVLEGLWRRWQALHPDIPGLIVPRPPVAPPDREELLAYSFDRAVICDDPRVVDLLVANRFHFENNCALLTEDGYPEAIFETVRTMLRNNPDITVFALHHATPRGLGLAQRLRDSPEWFAGIGRVVDVGLRPEHADELRGTWEPRGAGDATIAPLDPGWTEAWTLSLFALRPEQLVRRLYRAMNRQEVSRMAPGGGEVLLLPGFIGDAAPSSGDGDGFG